MIDGLDRPPAPRGATPLARELAAAVDAARLAGALIREAYAGASRVDYKVGDDPLTEADRAADRAIHTRLGEAFPGYGWLSEEDGAAATHAGSRSTWVVDPLDGTREFVARIPEFAVSIALVSDGRPVVAVVYNPVRDLLVAAERGRGAWVEGRRAAVTSTPALAPSLVLASRSETRTGLWDRFAGAFRVSAAGSIAYKLALVATGQADATFSVAPKHGWDVCAGTLLVEEAGGRVTRLDGGEMDFSAPDVLLDGMVASNGHLHEHLVELIGHRPGRVP